MGHLRTFSHLAGSAAICLATLLAAPAAHADVLDSFTLTGPGITATWTEPATFSTPDFSLFNFYGTTVSATINGVPGYSITADYYTLFYPQLSLVFSLPQAFGATPSQLPLSGKDVYTFTTVPANNPPPYLPDDIVGTFTPGVYTETYSSQQLGSQPVAYTLTIAAAAQTVTPEPPSILMLLTGALAGSTMLLHRRPGASRA